MDQSAHWRGLAFRLPPRVDYRPGQLYILPTPERAERLVNKSFRESLATVALLIAVVGGFAAISHQISQQYTNFSTQLGQLATSLNGRIDGVNQNLETKFDALAQRTLKVEAAVKVIGENQNEPLKDSVRQLLSSAAGALPKNPEIAAKEIFTANSIIETLRLLKGPSDQRYFRQTISQINLLAEKAKETQLVQTVYLTRLSLAQYRSALEERFEQGTVLSFVPMEHGIYITSPNHLLFGINYDFTRVTGDGISFLGKMKRTLAENNVIQRAVIKGGIQTLDGIHWRDVVFIGTHVRYDGGEVELKNVQFVDCTFDFPYSERAIRVTDYAILKGKYLTIGGSPS